jgi:hypothetical protein
LDKKRLGDGGMKAQIILCSGKVINYEEVDKIEIIDVQTCLISRRTTKLIKKGHVYSVAVRGDYIPKESETFYSKNKIKKHTGVERIEVI